MVEVAKRNRTSTSEVIGDEIDVESPKPWFRTTPAAFALTTSPSALLVAASLTTGASVSSTFELPTSSLEPLTSSNESLVTSEGVEA